MELNWQTRGVVPSQPASQSEVVESIPEGMPRLIWQVLKSRARSEKDLDHSVVQNWLTPSLKDLRDPNTLLDMPKAIQRLVQAFKNDEKICIYADYDLDGTSACALLKQALIWMGFKNVFHYQPSRLKEGYGLHNEAIKRLKDEHDITLMVTVDLGITAVEEVDYAKTLGIDVIISDHHLPKETLPRAHAVVNPNRGDCESSLGHLCGTGVAFYMVLALKRALVEQGLLQTDFDPKQLLDCFVIGTLTDMVPLIEENRVLVKHGMVQLAQTKRPGLRALLRALDLWGKPLTSQDVAIRFAPKLNALSRLEMGIRPIDLYLVETDQEAEALVERVLLNNQSRVELQKSAEAEAFDYAKSNPPTSCIFVYSKNFHRGVVGLVATKLCQEYKLPAFVGSVGPNRQIVGSVRMPDSSGLSALDAMEFAQDQLIQFGGHAAAAGFELREETAEAFRAKLTEHFDKKKLEPSSRCWYYDCDAELGDLNPVFMNWYEHLSPFGTQNAPPVFCLRNLRLSQVKELKGGHYRLTFADSAQITRNGIWFSPPKGHPASKNLKSGMQVSVLVEPQWNYFNGSKTLQFLVQDLALL